MVTVREINTAIEEQRFKAPDGFTQEYQDISDENLCDHNLEDYKLKGTTEEGDRLVYVYFCIVCDETKFKTKLKR